MLNTKTAETCKFEDLLKPTAQTAYRFGVIDGSTQALDLHEQFTPFAADYQRGYLDGALGSARVYEANAAAWLQANVNEALAIRTPVYVTSLGVNGVISGHSTCDGSRYRVSTFNRHFWRVDHYWVERSVLQVIDQNQMAAAA